jgi:hypothetical protein
MPYAPKWEQQEKGGREREREREKIEGQYKLTDDDWFNHLVEQISAHPTNVCVTHYSL